MPSPILFCHYGRTRYLDYTLPCAVRQNPDTEVVLLGDDDNAGQARKHGVRHLPWRRYADGEDIDTFHEVFREVRGSRCVYDSAWLKFVFLRWFVVRNFVEREGISRFWHFDSDTMVLEALRGHEHHFEGLDCTEQCGEGGCMNGFIARAPVVTAFVRKINELFRRPDYLARTREWIERHVPKTAFNEMIAYQTFRDEAQLKTDRLYRIRDGAIFDDCVCTSEGRFDMESLRTGHVIKRLLLGPEGRLYARARDGQMVRFVTLNLSHVPYYVFRNVYRHSLLEGPAEGAFRDLPVPPLVRLKYFLRHRTRPLRRALFRRR